MCLISCAGRESCLGNSSWASFIIQFESLDLLESMMLCIGVKTHCPPSPPVVLEICLSLSHLRVRLKYWHGMEIL